MLSKTSQPSNSSAFPAFVCFLLIAILVCLCIAQSTLNKVDAQTVKNNKSIGKNLEAISEIQTQVNIMTIDFKVIKEDVRLIKLDIYNLKNAKP